MVYYIHVQEYVQVKYLECHGKTISFYLPELQRDDTFEATIDIDASGKADLIIRCSKREIDKSYDIITLCYEYLQRTNDENII